jgi:hypothetical protein
MSGSVKSIAHAQAQEERPIGYPRCRSKMSGLTDEQCALLARLDRNTHCVYTRAFINDFSAVFGCEIRSRTYSEFGNLVGLAAVEFVLELCKRFGVVYELKMGRGAQVNACTDALRHHFANMPVPVRARPWRGPLSRTQPPRACKSD